MEKNFKIYEREGNRGAVGEIKKIKDNFHEKNGFNRELYILEILIFWLFYYLILSFSFFLFIIFCLTKLC